MRSKLKNLIAPIIKWAVFEIKHQILSTQLKHVIQTKARQKKEK